MKKMYPSNMSENINLIGDCIECVYKSMNKNTNYLPYNKLERIVERKTKITDFEIVKNIAKGGYGEVFLVRHTGSDISSDGVASGVTKGKGGVKDSGDIASTTHTSTDTIQNSNTTYTSTTNTNTIHDSNTTHTSTTNTNTIHDSNTQNSSTTHNSTTNTIHDSNPHKYIKKDQVYAMKRICKDTILKQPHTALYMAEKQLLVESINSDWLVSAKLTLQDDGYLYYFMDFIPGGDFMSLLAKEDILEEKWVKFYVVEIIAALNELHKLGWIHRDLKPDNILIGLDGHIKLADFGSSIRMCNGTAKSCFVVGTPDYVSPDILESTTHENEYGEDIDFWTLGVIIYEMVYGCTPFYSNTLVDTYRKITDIEYTFPFDISPDLKDLITNLIKKKDERMKIEDIKKHKFFYDINWDNIKNMIPPYIPEIQDELDTSNFIDTNFDIETRVPDKCNYIDFIGFSHDPRMEMCIKEVVDGIVVGDVYDGNIHGGSTHKDGHTISSDETQPTSDKTQPTSTITQPSRDSTQSTSDKTLQDIENMIETKMLEYKDLMTSTLYEREEYEYLENEIVKKRNELKDINNELIDKQEMLEEYFSTMRISGGMDDGMSASGGKDGMRISGNTSGMTYQDITSSMTYQDMTSDGMSESGGDNHYITCHGDTTCHPTTHPDKRIHNDTLLYKEDTKTQALVRDIVKYQNACMDALHTVEEEYENCKKEWNLKIRNVINLERENVKLKSVNTETLKKQVRKLKSELKEYQQVLEQELVLRKQLEDELKSMKNNTLKSVVLINQSFSCKLVKDGNNLVKDGNNIVKDGSYFNKDGSTINKHTNKVNEMIRIQDEIFHLGERSCSIRNVYIQELKNNEMYHESYKTRALILKIIFIQESRVSVSSGCRRSVKSLEDDLKIETSLLQGLDSMMPLLDGKQLQDAKLQYDGSLKKIKQLQAEIMFARKSTLTEDIPEDPIKLYEFNNHLFCTKTFPQGTFCEHCNDVLYGVKDQGFECRDCKMVVHKSCYILNSISCEIYNAFRSGSTYYVIMRSIEEKEKLLNVYENF